MRIGALFLLLLTASPAFAGERDSFFFSRQEKAEIRQIQSLNRLDQGQLEAVVEGERDCYNQQMLMQYNRMMRTTPTGVAPLMTRRGQWIAR